tara:strand:+ start:3324 stop:3851 length:528 start_codon:yes stop_codon:yes gene_type:complete
MMKKSWSKTKANWADKTALPGELSNWAIEAVDISEQEITNLENAIQEEGFSPGKINEIDNYLKQLRKNIRKELAVKENSLDDISLNSPNSYKLQVSVPSNLTYLLKTWAAAEGRDLSSVALQCLETGLREMKSNGSIPIAAIKRYEKNCEKRIALAEAKKLWETHESQYLDISKT